MKAVKRILAKVMAFIMVVTTLSSVYTTAVATEELVTGTESVTQAEQPPVQADAVTETPVVVEQPAVTSEEVPVDSQPQEEYQAPVQPDANSPPAGITPVEGDGYLTDEQTGDVQVDPSVPVYEETPTPGEGEVLPEGEQNDTETVNKIEPIIVINYDTTVGGTVTNASETIDTATAYTIMGSEAQADDGYVFTGWIDADGYLVSTEYEYVPGADAIDRIVYYGTPDENGVIETTFTAQFEEGVEVTDYVYVGQTLIKVRYNETAFEGKVKLDAKEITTEDDEYAQVEAAVDEATGADVAPEDVNFAAFDIFFLDEESMVVEPKKGSFVAVSISTTGKETPAPEEIEKVLHIDGETNKVEEIANVESTDRTLEFVTDSFSIYIVVGGTSYPNQMVTSVANVYTPKATNGAQYTINGTSYYYSRQTDITFRIDQHDRTYTLDANAPELKNADYVAVYYVPGAANAGYGNQRVVQWKVSRAATDGAITIDAVLENGDTQRYIKSGSNSVANADKFAWLEQPEDNDAKQTAYVYKPGTGAGEIEVNGKKYIPASPAKTNVTFSGSGNNVTATLDDFSEYESVYYRDGSGNYGKVTQFSFRNTAGRTNPSGKWIVADVENHGAEAYYDSSVVPSTVKSSSYVWLLKDSRVPTGTVQANVYLLLNASQPPAPLHDNYDKGKFGPSKDNTPYFLVQINLDELNKLMTPYIDSENRIYYTYIAHSDYPDNEGNTNAANSFFVNVMMNEKVMPNAADRQKFMDTFGRYGSNEINYIGYVLKKESDQGIRAWHIDGIARNIPNYWIEIYEKGQSAPFGTHASTAPADYKPNVEDRTTAYIMNKFSVTRDKVNWDTMTVTLNDGSKKKFSFEPLPDRWAGGKHSGVDPSTGKVTYETVVPNQSYLARFELSFENVNTLTIEKKIEVTDGNQTARAAALGNTYRFTVYNGNNAVKFDREAQGAYSYSQNGKLTTMEITGEGAVTLYDLPAGSYRVEETGKGNDIAGYNHSVSYSPANGGITITKGGTTAAVVTNRYEPSTGTLKITKQVVDETLDKRFTNAVYSFTVTDANGQTLRFNGSGASYAYAANGTVSAISIRGNGTATITGVPAGRYTVLETNPTATQLQSQGYTLDTEYTPARGNVTVVANQDDAHVIVKNTVKHTPECVNISGTKIWIDNKEPSQRPPVTFRLEWSVDGINFYPYKGPDNNEPQWTVTLENGETEYKFENMQQRERGTGRFYIYRVKEDVPPGYELVSETPNGTGGTDFTNRLKQETKTISGTKTWIDGNSATRPALTIELYRNNARIAMRTLTGNQTTYSFENLDVYDENRKEYTYEVREIVPSGYEKIDEKNNSTGGKDFTNRLLQQPVSISGTKTWVDGGKTSAQRPALVIELWRKKGANGTFEKLNDKTLTLANGATSYSFQNLDRYADDRTEYVYEAREVVPQGYELQSETANNTGGKDFVNVLKQEEINISGKKTWVDGNAANRPPLTVMLYRDYVLYKTESFAAGAESYSFGPLEKYAPDRHEYRYEVFEVVPSGYDLTNETVNRTGGKDFENTLQQTYTSISGTKVWIDGNRMSWQRPALVIQLLQDNQPYGSPVNFGQGATQWSFNNLPKFDSQRREYKYTFKEMPVDNYETTVDYENNVITNRIEQIPLNISGTKTWVKPANVAAPALTIQLLRKEGQYGAFSVADSVTLRNGQTSYAFNDLPTFDENTGTQYFYDVQEVVPQGWTQTANVQNATGGRDFVNTIAQEPVSVSGTKEWRDDKQFAYQRPVLTIVLNRDGQYYRTGYFGNGAERWSFDNLDKYDVNGDGHEYEYTVIEPKVPGYKTTRGEGNHFINTIDQEYTTLSGTKTWIDGNKNSSERPELIIRVLRDSVYYTEKNFGRGATSWRFEGLEKFNPETGKSYSYTWQEVLSPNSDYVSSRNGNDLVNTIEQIPTEVSGNKTWVDGNKPASQRPAPTFILYRDNIEYRRETFAPGATSYRFTDLPTYDLPGETYTRLGDGHKFEYRVEEVKPDNYTVTKNGNDFVNTIEQKETEVSGTKTWIGPVGTVYPTITIELYRDNGTTPFRTTTLSNGQYTYKFDKLPKFDETDGHEYVYTVAEVEVDGYTTTRDGNNFTNTVEQEYVDIAGVKTWVDPEGTVHPLITIELWRDNVLYDTRKLQDGEVNYSFDDLPLYDLPGYSYTVSGDGHAFKYELKEPRVEGYGDPIPVGYNFTNPIGQKETELSGTKTWIDGGLTDRPELKVSLYRDGSYVRTESFGKGAESWSFTKLDRYDPVDGHEYVYTAKEENVNGYTSVMTGNDIVNTIGQKYVRIGGEKKWIAPLGTELPDVTIDLLKNGKKIDSVTIKNGTTVYSFDNLPLYDLPGEDYTVNGDGKEFKYSLFENVPEGYKQTKAETKPDAYGNITVNFENTIDQEYETLDGTKTWNDPDGTENRPDLQVDLYKDGVKIITAQSFGKGATEWSFQNLPVYDLPGYEYTVKGDGHRFKYEAVEVKPAGYTTDVDDEGNFINTIEQDETEVKGVKTWIEPADTEHDEVVIELYRNGTKIDETKLAKGKDKKVEYKFEKLDKFDANGKEYTYTVKEVLPKGYTSAQDGYDFTNTIDQEYIDYTVVKKWIAPEDEIPEIEVQLWRDKGNAGETMVDSVKLNKEKLTHKFEQLPKYDVITDGQIIDKGDGHAFNYTVEEIVPAGFSQKNAMSSIDLKGNVQTTFENEVDQKPVQISVKKTWDDEAFEKRPTSVTFELTAFAEGTTVDLSKVKTVVTLPEDGKIEGDAWTYTWEDLDKYADNGQVIEYNVEEKSIDALETLGYTSEKSGNAKDGFVFTNKRTPDPELDKEAKIAKGLATRPEPKIELENRNEEVTYTLKTKTPDREKIESFVITDTLKDVMQFVSTADTVKVEVGGRRLSGVAKIEGQTLTVTLEKQNLMTKNADVTVEFVAKIREKMADGSEVNLAPYIKESGRPEVDNTAYYQIKVPDAPAEEPVPSNDIIIIPPDVELKKEVDGSETETMVLENKNDPIPYTLKTMIPERGNLTEFVITDTLEDVLEFAKDENDALLPVTVKVGGQEVSGADTISGQVLTVNLGAYVGDAYKGQPVQIDFTARIKADATATQLAKHIDQATNKAKVPNEAAYRIVADGKVTEDTSNIVYVTPPDNKPEKTVEDETKKQMIMTNRDQDIPYTITAEVPARKDMVALTIEDTIDKVLKFKEGAPLTATADGNPIPAANITTAGQKLTVIVPDQYVQKPGTKIVVKFTTVIREDAVIDDSYISEATGMPEILNVGYLKITVPGPKDELIPTDETKVFPTGGSLDKKVGNNATHKDLTLEDPIANYTLTAKLPTRDGLTKFVIEDTLDEMLVFDGDVVVNVAGSVVQNAATVSGQKLTVTISGNTLRAAQGMNATVTFNAKVKDGVTAQELIEKGYLNTETNRVEIPNKASYHVHTQASGDDEPVEQGETPPVTVTPPEDEPKKTAEAEGVAPDETQINIARKQTVTYTITAQVPVNDKLDTFQISDTIIDELEFVGDKGNATFKVGTTDLTSLVGEPEGQTISVLIKDAGQYKGQTAVFTFQAKIREGADLSKYITGGGKPELPNTAEILTIKLPGDKPVITPTNKTNIIPDDPKPEKKVNGEEKIELNGRYDEVTYTITTKMPEREEIEKFEIVDTLVPEMEFRSAQNAVKVTVNGQAVSGAAVIKDQTLTVSIPKNLLTVANMGKDVVVEFKAALKQGDIDLTQYIDETSKRVEVPNVASYKLKVPNEKEVTEDTNPAKITPPDTSIEKSVMGDTHYDMQKRDEQVEYTVTTVIPERANLTQYVIRDTLEDALNFYGAAQVQIGGGNAYNVANVGRELTVVIDGETLQNNLGKTVTITFKAVLAEDADLAKYVNVNNNRVEIPNVASFEVYTTDGGDEPVDKGDTPPVTVTPPDPELKKEAEGENADKKLTITGRDQEIPYIITTTMPVRETISSLVISDKLEKVLRFKNGGNVKVMVGETDMTNLANVNEAEKTLTVTFNNEQAKANQGKKIVVTFTAEFEPGADLSDYITAAGVPEVPNEAIYTLNVPGNDPVIVPSDIPWIVPGDPGIVKEVEGGTHYDLPEDNRYEAVTYTIKTKMPERDNISKFEITDTLKDVMEFVSSANQVDVKLNGEQIRNAARISGKTLTVTFPSRYFAQSYRGKDIVVTFEARISDRATDEQLAQYLSTDNNRVEVPNTAVYTLKVGNDPEVTDESDPVTITPPDPEIDKKVGEGETHYDMPDLTSNVTYTIKTAVPVRDTITSFVIEDTLVPELEYRSTTAQVRVRIGGRDASVPVQIVGQTLRVTLGNDLAKANRGKEVVVTFDAGIRAGADVMKYMSQDTNRVDIPNYAKYILTLPGRDPIEKTTEEEITITPGDPEIEKEVTNIARTNADRTHLMLNYGGEVYRYTLRTQIPMRTNINQYIIEDVLVPEMKFESTATDVVVRVGGRTLTGAAKIDGQMLEVVMPESARRNAGAEVEIEFFASLREETRDDLAKYMSGGRIMVPNRATSYLAFGGTQSARASRETAVKNTNYVYVTPPDPEYITYNVSKTWDDADNQDGKRPTTITVRLFADGTEVAGKSPAFVNAQGGWRHTFTQIERYAWNGDEIVYSILEDVIDGYTTTYTNNGTNNTRITNSYTPELTNVNVVKIWNDAGNAYNARPASVTVRLFANNTATGQTLTLRAANGWTGTFSGLDKYANGNIIDYTVREDEVARYTPTISREGAYSFRITNSLSDIPTTPTPDPTPVPTPVPTPYIPPANPVEGGQVLGVRRTTDPAEDPAVLGARRGKTGDASTEKRTLLMMLSSAAALLATLAGRKKKKDEAR